MRSSRQAGKRADILIFADFRNVLQGFERRSMIEGAAERRRQAGEGLGKGPNRQARKAAAAGIDPR
jgi:hypothetical protein